MFIEKVKSIVQALIKILANAPKNKKDEMLRIAFSAISSWRIDGDYFEFGVYEGRAMIAAWKNSLRSKRKIRFFAFDSFEGLPSSEEGGNKFPKGKYTCSKNSFLKNLSNAGVDTSLVTCISGFYDKSLTLTLQDSSQIIRLQLFGLIVIYIFQLFQYFNL